MMSPGVRADASRVANAPLIFDVTVEAATAYPTIVAKGLKSSFGACPQIKRPDARFNPCRSVTSPFIDAVTPALAMNIARDRDSDARYRHVGISARSEEHTSELQSLMRISYADFCLKKKPKTNTYTTQS